MAESYEVKLKIEQLDKIEAIKLEVEENVYGGKVVEATGAGGDLEGGVMGRGKTFWIP